MDRKFCKNIIDSSKEAFLYKKKGGKKKTCPRIFAQLDIYVWLNIIESTQVGYARNWINCTISRLKQFTLLWLLS